MVTSHAGKRAELSTYAGALGSFFSSEEVRAKDLYVARTI
jgi:hypothetical protein